jgi:hypothetical protein
MPNGGSFAALPYARDASGRCVEWRKSPIAPETDIGHQHDQPFRIYREQAQALHPGRLSGDSDTSTICCKSQGAHPAARLSANGDASRLRGDEFAASQSGVLSGYGGSPRIRPQAPRNNNRHRLPRRSYRSALGIHTHAAALPSRPQQRLISETHDHATLAMRQVMARSVPMALRNVMSQPTPSTSAGLAQSGVACEFVKRAE